MGWVPHPSEARAMPDSAQPAPTAASTDPTTLAVMQGFPPPADKTVRVSDTTSWRFPNTRWSFSHQRELGPSAAIRRGPAPATALLYGLRDDLDAVPFVTQDGR